MNKSDSIADLANALRMAQKDMPVASKDKSNPFFKSKYAPLEEVLPLAISAMGKHGLSFTQMVSNIDGQSALTTMIMHDSGEWISADQPLVLDKENPQGQGSAITYARRYALMSAIGMVADEDDDGNKASTSVAASPIKFATAKQIDWMRGVASKITGYEHAEELDAWIKDILTVAPQHVPISKVKAAIDKLDEAKASMDADAKVIQEDLHFDDMEVSDDDIKALEDGTLPY